MYLKYFFPYRGCCAEVSQTIIRIKVVVSRINPHCDSDPVSNLRTQITTLHLSMSINNLQTHSTYLYIHCMGEHSSMMHVIIGEEKSFDLFHIVAGWLIAPEPCECIVNAHTSSMVQCHHNPLCTVRDFQNCSIFFILAPLTVRLPAGEFLC